MIIGYFYIRRTRFTPRKTDAILIVDADAHLTFAASPKLFETVPGRYFEFIRRYNGIELVKFAACALP
ncbi:MAG: hypothetical protein JU82_00060 [Sulfuricurvum sp. MLSB]|nr:MAG: hypothetical protein JU82_00060 [Sulfuricurvum sp. MLSB]